MSQFIKQFSCTAWKTNEAVLGAARGRRGALAQRESSRLPVLTAAQMHTDIAETSPRFLGLRRHSLSETVLSGT